MPIALLLHGMHVANVQTAEDTLCDGLEDQLPIMLQRKVQEVHAYLLTRIRTCNECAQTHHVCISMEVQIVRA